MGRDERRPAGAAATAAVAAAAVRPAKGRRLLAGRAAAGRPVRSRLRGPRPGEHADDADPVVGRCSSGRRRPRPLRRHRQRTAHRHRAGLRRPWPGRWPLGKRHRRRFRRPGRGRRRTGDAGGAGLRRVAGFGEGSGPASLPRSTSPGCRCKAPPPGRTTGCPGSTRTSTSWNGQAVAAALALPGCRSGRLATSTPASWLLMGVVVRAGGADRDPDLPAGAAGELAAAGARHRVRLATDGSRLRRAPPASASPSPSPSPSSASPTPGSASPSGPGSWTPNSRL